MDSFEPIRKAAEDLHHQLVGDGTPKKPMERVTAAIKHLKLELTWLPTGDPALKGARAVFDDQSGTIFAEDIGNESQRALVVAHEISFSEFRNSRAGRSGTRTMSSCRQRNCGNAARSRWSWI